MVADRHKFYYLYLLPVPTIGAITGIEASVGFDRNQPLIPATAQNVKTIEGRATVPARNHLIRLTLPCTFPEISTGQWRHKTGSRATLCVQRDRCRLLDIRLAASPDGITHTISQRSGGCRVTWLDPVDPGDVRHDPVGISRLVEPDTRLRSASPRVVFHPRRG